MLADACPVHLHSRCSLIRKYRLVYIPGQCHISGYKTDCGRQQSLHGIPDSFHGSAYVRNEDGNGEHRRISWYHTQNMPEHTYQCGHR